MAMDCIEKNENIILEEIDNGAILYDPNFAISTLNEVAYDIWQAIDNVEKIHGLIDKLHSTYDVDRKTLYHDVELILQEFKKKGLIRFENNIDISFSKFKSNGKNILYFPKRRIALEVDNNTYRLIAKNDISSLKKSDKDFIINSSLLNNIESNHLRFCASYPTRITLMPTNDCNLRCKYCYSQAGIRKKQYVEWNAAKAALDYAFSNLIKANNEQIKKRGFSLGFMGGGEPTLNWDVLKKSVNYIRQLGIKYNINTKSDLTTNAVLNDKQIDWICENIDFIRISFDGPKEIQNSQRPAIDGDSFKSVYKSINKFDKKNKDYLIRCTLTEKSINRMQEIFRFFINNFNMKNKGIIFNPVYVCGSCIQSDLKSINRKQFVKNFMDTQRLSDRYDVDVVSMYDKVRTTPVPKLPYCGYKKGNCFFTAEGYMSCCSEVDSKSDIRSSLFFFGKYDNKSNKVVISKEKMQQLYEFEVGKQLCENCNISEFCPGPCLVRGADKETLSHWENITTTDDVISPLNDDFIKKAGYLLGLNKEAKTQCGLNKDISRNEILNALAYNSKNFQKGTFKVRILKDRNDDSGIKKAVQLFYAIDQTH